MSTELSLEEKASTADTWQHIHRIQELTNIAIGKLLDRAVKHDQSKLSSPEVQLFTKYGPELKKHRYGSEEYKNGLGKIKLALDHHYANNSHHPEFHTQNEIWKPVKNFEDLYEVSNYGNVRSLDRSVSYESSGIKKTRKFKGKTLHQYISTFGYRHLQFRCKKRNLLKNVFVHVLVAEAFIPNPLNKPHVNHKDGIKTNNHISNLEWVTQSENLAHAYETGLKKADIKYVVTCTELGISTFGTVKMAQRLNKMGYEKVIHSGINNALRTGCKHYDLTFTSKKFETWMDSPVYWMGLLDIIEMFIDWKAASERQIDGNFRESIKINAERFNINPDMMKILLNTADYLGW